MNNGVQYWTTVVIDGFNLLEVEIVRHSLIHRFRTESPESTRR